jgi:hypothetical protein
MEKHFFTGKVKGGLFLKPEDDLSSILNSEFWLLASAL